MTDSSNSSRVPCADRLRIAEVPAPRDGMIGLTLCPGKVGPGRRHDWHRDIEAELAAITAWGAGYLVTLMEDHEVGDYRVPALGDRVRAHLGVGAWFHLPIVDRTIPGADWEAVWTAAAASLHAHLDGGGRVLVDCFGGLGRTGIVASRLLVERGMDAGEALRRVREAHPGAVETPGQERWVIEGCGPTLDHGAQRTSDHGPRRSTP